MAKEQKRTVQTIFETAQNNANIVNNLKKIEIINQPVAFNSNIEELILFEKEDASIGYSNAIKINQQLENFPEWMIPYTYVKQQFYSENGVDLENASLGGSTGYYWKENGENIWIFQFFIYQSAFIVNQQRVATYFDLSLHFWNPRNYHEI